MLEKVVFHVTDHFRRITGRKKLCLAGGVALNCSLNGRLAYSGLFEDVFVYPAASDCGLPVGSALAAYFLRHKQPRREQLKTLYLGSPIGKNDEIGEGLCQWKNLVRFEKVDDIVRKGAELLAADKVIGWVQGRSEFAPRALGNRSILADPRPEKNKERINSIVKKREGFRPFAPSVMAEHASAYFDLPANKIDSPYMMFVFGVREKYRQQLKAVTHVDGTARVQTVSKKENPRYWALIDAFREISGISVILNTSFNNNAEPIVDSVDDAVVCFLTTRLDYLLIGDYLVEKPDLPADRLAELYLSIPPYMNLKRCETFNRAAGLNPGQRFELSNTFNEKVMEVNGSLFELLVKADGRCSLGCLMRSQGIGGGKECEGLLQKITELWEKRLIRLSPVPLT
jgi:carbamoyltransferase